MLTLRQEVMSSMLWRLKKWFSDGFFRYYLKDLFRVFVFVSFGEDTKIQAAISLLQWPSWVTGTNSAHHLRLQMSIINQ